MKDRIATTFSAANDSGRACFVAYLCAGDPDFETSFEACKTVVENGCDVLEIGVPFSDPLADGLTNQLAAQRALESGMTAEKVFELVRRLREISDVPIILYTYYNMVFAQGERHYAKLAVAAGVDGMLVLDLPPEESETWLKVCEEEGLKTVFIVAPTTPDSRVGLIAKATSGFVYYVSRTGVTGERDSLPTDLEEAVKGIKAHTDKPVAVGFGISNAEQVKAVGAISDGVIVGSSIVNCIASNLGNSEAIIAALEGKMKSLTAGLQ